MIDFLPAVPPALVAAAVALLVFVLAGLLLGIARRRRDQVHAALAALCAMKWREFAHHVVGVLAQRGLRQDDLDRRPGDDGFDIRMTRGSASYLVQCKQVGSRTLGEHAVREFGSMVRLQGAEGGILVTTGEVDAGARRAAASSGIELLSGYQLWRQLRPLLPLDLVREIEAAARARRGRKALAAVGLGVAAGAMAYLLVTALGGAPGPDAPAAVQQPQAAPPAAAGTSQPAAARAIPPPTAPSADALPDRMPDPTLTEGQLAARRGDAERNVRELPQVADATWSTRSTLVLTLHRAGEDPVPEAAVTATCETLVRYEELRYTRLQVHTAEPRSPDEARVRWRQCR